MWHLTMRTQFSTLHRPHEDIVICKSHLLLHIPHSQSIHMYLVGNPILCSMFYIFVLIFVVSYTIHSQFFVQIYLDFVVSHKPQSKFYKYTLILL